MSSDKDLDELKVKDGLPNFGPDPKATKSKTAGSKTAAAGPGNDNAGKAAAPAMGAEAIKAMPTGMRIIRGGGADVIEFAQAQKNAAKALAEASAQASTQSQTIVSTSSKTEKGFDATVGVNKDGVNGSVGMSFKKTTEVKAEAGGKPSSQDEAIYAALKARGIDLKSGKIPLDVLAEVLEELLGENAPDASKLDAKARDKMLADISKRLMTGLREERGTELRAGFNAGGGGGRATNAQEGGYQGSSVGAELVATGGALIGGLASLATGSVRALGAAVGAAGRGIGGIGNWGKPEFAGSSYDHVSVMPTISEYRLNQIDKSTANYEKSLNNFWKIEPMAALRSEIEERARKTGISVPDAMEKMKPGGEWGELHDKFVKAVAASPESLQAKVTLDKALQSYTRQYENGTEELMNADMGNPDSVKARKKVEASKEKMEGLAAQTPVFGGETESHAERLKAAIEAVIERVREMLQAVGQKLFGGGNDHAAP